MIYGLAARNPQGQAGQTCGEQSDCHPECTVWVRRVFIYLIIFNYFERDICGWRSRPAREQVQRAVILRAMPYYDTRRWRIARQPSAARQRL